MDESGTTPISVGLSDSRCKVRICKDIVTIQCAGDHLVEKLNVYKSNGQFCDVTILVPESSKAGKDDEILGEKSHVNDDSSSQIKSSKAGKDNETLPEKFQVNADSRSQIKSLKTREEGNDEDNYSQIKEKSTDFQHVNEDNGSENKDGSVVFGQVNKDSSSGNKGKGTYLGHQSEKITDNGDEKIKGGYGLRKKKRYPIVLGRPRIKTEISEDDDITKKRKGTKLESQSKETMNDGNKSVKSMKSNNIIENKIIASSKEKRQSRKKISNDKSNETGDEEKRQNTLRNINGNNKVVKKLSDYKEIVAHSCVISAGSEVFYNILTNPFMKGRSDKKLVIDNLSSEHVERCISYLYGDTIVFFKKDLDNVLSAAVKLKIESLENRCRILKTLLKDSSYSSNAVTYSVQKVSSTVQSEGNSLVDSTSGSEEIILDQKTAALELRKLEESKIVISKATSQNLLQNVGLKTSSLPLPRNNKTAEEQQSSQQLLESDTLSESQVSEQQSVKNRNKKYIVIGLEKDSLADTRVKVLEEENVILSDGKHKVLKISSLKSSSGNSLEETTDVKLKTMSKSSNRNSIEMQNVVSNGDADIECINDSVKNGSNNENRTDTTITVNSVSKCKKLLSMSNIKTKEATPSSDLKATISSEQKILNSLLKAPPISQSDAALLSKFQATPLSKLQATPLSQLQATPLSHLHVTPLSQLQATPLSQLQATPISQVKVTPLSQLPANPLSHLQSSASSPSKTTESTESQVKANVETTSAKSNQEIDRNNQLVRTMQNNVLISQETMLKEAPLRVDNMDTNKLTPNAKALLQALANSLHTSQANPGSNVVPNSQYYLSIPPEQLSSVFAVPLNIPVFPIVSTLPEGSRMLLPPKNNFENSDPTTDISLLTSKFRPIKSADDFVEDDNTSPIPFDMNEHVKIEDKTETELAKTRNAYPNDFVPSKRKRINQVIVPEDSAGQALLHHSYAFDSVERKTREETSINTKMKPKRFPNLSERKAHYKFQNLLPKLCDHCGEMFPSAKACRRHMKEVQGNYKYCQYCSFKTVFPATLKLHQRRHSKEKPFKCSYCDFRAITKTEIGFHEVVHTKQKDIVCELCGKCFARRQSFRIHRLKEHGIGNRRRGQPMCYECDQCDFKHPSFSVMKNHKLSHSTLKLHECSVCGRSYKRKSQLRRHRKEIHKIQDPKNMYTLANYTELKEDFNRTENSNDSQQSETVGHNTDNNVKLSKQATSNSEFIDNNYVQGNSQTSTSVIHDSQPAENLVPMSINFIPADEYDDDSDEDADETNTKIVQNIVEIISDPYTPAKHRSTVPGQSPNRQGYYTEAARHRNQIVNQNTYGQAYNNNSQVNSRDRSVINYRFGEGFLQRELYETSTVHITNNTRIKSNSQNVDINYEVQETNNDFGEYNDEMDNSDYESMYLNLQYGNQQKEASDNRGGSSLDPCDEVIIDSLDQIEAEEAAEHLEIMNTYSITI